MNKIAPSNKFVDDSGGSVVFTVPLTCHSEIAPLFKLIEENPEDEEIKYDSGSDQFKSNENPWISELKSLVSDCGISHSTLEEVFMKVTGRKESKVKKNMGKDDSPDKLTERNIKKKNSLNK